jgi:hypothetical protein
MRELAIEIIRGGLIAKIDELGHRPRCEQCPLGTCSYCELRGCLALLKLFPPPKPRRGRPTLVYSRKGPLERA